MVALTVIDALRLQVLCSAIPTSPAITGIVYCIIDKYHFNLHRLFQHDRAGSNSFTSPVSIDTTTFAIPTKRTAFAGI